MQIEQLHREMLGRSSPPPGDPWHKGSKRTWEWVWPLARRGYEAGASINVGAVLWDVAKQWRCEDPFPMTGSHGVLRSGVTESIPAMNVAVRVPCRKCRQCLRTRAFIWADRARIEVGQAPFSMFGTFTLSPDSQYRMLARARAHLHEEGVDLDTLPAESVFRWRCWAIGQEVTRYQKRVRRALSPLRVRFLWVCEMHRSGLPHLHALCHVIDFPDGTHPDRVFSALKTKWVLGFSKLDQVARDSVKEVRYVTKYLAKHNLARVRASVAYGQLLSRSE